VRIFATHHEAEETTMTRHTSSASRRRFIKISGAGLVVAPFASALFSGAAQAVDAVSESEPTATALGYKMDATKASNRKDSTAVCGNCSLYSGKPGASDGPCSVFGGKLVNAKGWCTAWVKKA
jgi:hypothetical protein